jgi:hypothetical protein
MKLEDILKKQKDKGKEISRFKASTLSIEDYTRDKSAPRPYNDNFINDTALIREEAGVDPILDLKLEQKKIEVIPKVKKVNPVKKVVKRRKKDELNYEDLSGNSKLVVDEIISICLVLGDLTTGFIEKKELCKRLDLKAGSLKTTCVRLKEKNALIAFETTKGRGSKWKFTLSKNILQQFKDAAIH